MAPLTASDGLTFLLRASHLSLSLSLSLSLLFSFCAIIPSFPFCLLSSGTLPAAIGGTAGQMTTDREQTGRVLTLLGMGNGGYDDKTLSRRAQKGESVWSFCERNTEQTEAGKGADRGKRWGLVFYYGKLVVAPSCGYVLGNTLDPAAFVLYFFIFFIFYCIITF